MQQNAPGQSHPARVQFPEQLTGSEIPRPPSVRPLPRVGSQNRVPSSVRSSHHVGESSSFERTRTSSTGSSGRPDGIGLGYPSTRSPSHGPSPLGPGRRRSSGPQVHRKKDSGENFDASRYDIDDAFDDNGALDEYSVSAEHLEGIAKILDKRKRLAEAKRAVEQAEAAHMAAAGSSPADLLFSRNPSSRTPRAVLRPLEPDSTTTAPSTIANVSSQSPFDPFSTGVRSDSPSSQERGSGVESASSSKENPQDENWPKVFKKRGNDKHKGKMLMTEEDYQALERDMEERIVRIKNTTSSGGWERTRTAADQLRRRYNIILPTLAPGKKPFNPLDVIRWRRKEFEDSFNSFNASSPRILTQEEAIERHALSWRPHLSDLYDPHNVRYRSRLYAPWHTTALTLEQYMESQRKPMTPSIGSAQASPQRATSVTDVELSPNRAHTDSGPGEDSNPSGAEIFTRSFGSLRRIKKSFPGLNRSVDLSSRRSPHQSKTSVSSLNIFSHGGPASPTSSKAQLNRLIGGFMPPKPLGEQSDEGEHSGPGSISAPEKEGAVSRVRKKEDPARLSASALDQLRSLSSGDDQSQHSSDEGKVERKGKLRFPRPRFSRDETAVPPGHKPSHSIQVRSVPEERDDEASIGSIPLKSDLQKLMRSPVVDPIILSNEKVRKELKKRAEEERLDRTYDRREGQCHELDRMVRSINQEQYQLLQLGREYIHQINRLKQVYGLEDLDLLTDEELRILTEPTTRNQTRHDTLMRDPRYTQQLRRNEREAIRIHQEIKDGKYAPPLLPDQYGPLSDDLDIYNKRLFTVEKDLDYVARVATDHSERSRRLEGALKSLRDALGAAFTHSSQVYRELNELETLVAASRPVPTWKRISNLVKPMLSWGVTILTWILKLLGEVLFVLSFFIPRFIRNLFHWEMLSGKWPVFIYMAHLIILLLLQWKFGWVWSPSFGGEWSLLQPVLIQITMNTLVYMAAQWYIGVIREHILFGWLESANQPGTLVEWFERHGYGLLVVLGGFLPIILLYIIS